MKYFSQFLIIMGFTLLGEVLQRVVPIPVPAAVYGLVLLLLSLCLKLIRLEQVKEVGGFLTSILPLLFVSPAVGITEYWGLIAPNLLPLCLIVAATTALVFGIAGRVTQALEKGGKKGHE